MKEVNKRKGLIRRNKHKYLLINHLVMANAETINPYDTLLTLGEKTLEFKLAAPARKIGDTKIYCSYSDSFSSGSDVRNESETSSENLEEKSSREKSIELAREYFRTRQGTCL